LKLKAVKFVWLDEIRSKYVYLIIEVSAIYLNYLQLDICSEFQSTSKGAENVKISNKQAQFSEVVEM